MQTCTVLYYAANRWMCSIILYTIQSTSLFIVVEFVFHIAHFLRELRDTLGGIIQGGIIPLVISRHFLRIIVHCGRLSMELSLKGMPTHKTNQ